MLFKYLFLLHIIHIIVKLFWIIYR